LSIIKHVTLQKIVAHDLRYDLRIYGLTIRDKHAPKLHLLCPKNNLQQLNLLRKIRYSYKTIATIIKPPTLFLNQLRFEEEFIRNPSAYDTVTIGLYNKGNQQVYARTWKAAELTQNCFRIF